MKELLRLCFVLTLIGAVCAALMAFVDQKTKDPIEKSQEAEKMDAVKAVMPPSNNDPEKDAVTVKEGDAEYKFFRGKEDGVLVGAAFVVVAPGGYGGDIEILVGVDTARVVTGVEILKHAETAGLGSNITKPEFKNQFKGKSVTNPSEWAVKKDGGTFKQITGATISSRAVTGAIARGLELLEEHKAEVFGATTKGAGKAAAPEKPAAKKPAGNGGA